MRLLRPLLVTLLFLLAGCSDGGDDASDDDGTGGTGGTGGAGGTGGTGGTGGNNTQPEPEPEDVTLTVSLSGAYPATIAYDPATLSVPAGANVTLTFTNDDQNPLVSHDWVLEGFESTASTDVIANGESDTVTFLAPTEPGDYAFYCSVQGHRGNGMEGTLTVA